MLPIEIAAWLVCGIPALALAVYCTEVTAGLAEGRKIGARSDRGAPVAVLIPAHNEAEGIAATVTGLSAIAPSGTRILVVADNCEDDTAVRARAAGAEVAVRLDPVQRGKGYALSFGRDVLSQNAPKIVIVMDADSAFAPGSIELLCDAAGTGEPAQAANLLIPDRSAPALVQISSFALLVKNLVRSRGLSRIGGCALLTGTGMAFPWAIFASAPLATGDIAEDLGLGIALTRQGVRTRLLTDAVVRSRAASLGDAAAQRRRWEHGFLANALRHAVPTLAAGMARGSRSMIALGLHLLVPPLALLFLLAGGALMAAGMFAALWSIWAPAIALAVVMALALALTALAWLRYGRDTLRFTALLQAPLYVAWKIPNYLRFLVKRETHWRRARREGDA